ncbi:MAG: hypothetical protein ACP5O0_08910 [Acidimicrobiales bacterium]
MTDESVGIGTSTMAGSAVILVIPAGNADRIRYGSVNLLACVARAWE